MSQESMYQQRAHSAIPVQSGSIRRPLVECAIEDLARAIEDLSQVVPALASRLEPLLGPRLTGAEGDVPGAPRAALPPFGESIRMQTERVRVIEAAVRDLIHRLEI